MTPRLTPKQEQFCQEYLIDLNATAAAIRAGFSAATARSIGHENLTKPDIQERLAELTADRSVRTGITQDQALHLIADCAFFDLLDVLNSDGTPKPIGEMSRAARAAIRTIETRETTPTRNRCESVKIHRITLTDRVRALELLARHLGLFSEHRQSDGRATLESLLADSWTL